MWTCLAQISCPETAVRVILARDMPMKPHLAQKKHPREKKSKEKCQSVENVENVENEENEENQEKDK